MRTDTTSDIIIWAKSSKHILVVSHLKAMLVQEIMAVSVMKRSTSQAYKLLLFGWTSNDQNVNEFTDQKSHLATHFSWTTYCKSDNDSATVYVFTHVIYFPT